MSATQQVIDRSMDTVTDRPVKIVGIGGSLRPESYTYRALDYAAAPHIIVMGNEQQGLTETLAQACTSLVRIAMSGRADSMNLAVATA
ncbi:MAG: TrmH family RNA methyltransferase, partial [Cyanobacteria bacterium J06555_12]